jgi:PKHD-type hydroxylase
MIYHTIQNNCNERAKVTYPYVWWDGLFSNDELNAMCQYFESQGTMGKGKLNVLDSTGKSVYSSESSVRVSDINFHYPNKDTQWIFDRFNLGISQVNTRYYGYDLNGYDAIQYGEYRSEVSGRYDWHMDIMLGGDRADEHFQTRKLSITFLLNEPGVDFEGGELQFNLDSEKDLTMPECRRGRMIAFPSWALHRVNPVTKGTRKSLVIWVLGPKFK